MKLLNKIMPIILFIVISACGPVVTPNPKEQSLSMPAITQTYTPTETNTATITNTPTQTNTPTETPFPRPEYNKEAPLSTNDFTPIASDAQEALVDQDVVSTPKLDINAEPMNVGDLHKESGDQVFIIHDNIGVNLLPRAAISRIIPNVGDLRKILWEGIIKVNGHNERIFFATTEVRDDEQGESRLYQLQASAKHLTFRLYVSEGSAEGDSPVEDYVLPHVDPNAYTKFRQGGNNFDTVFWAVLIGYKK